eukprot:TRINITY_DN6627_c1_g1_i3.p1 TRINITY_DN6627_c1_g1~~TRINITY_DN6627_c1_g1_i3.p1  ORF type:complete len:187 (-),score=12.72 TRINITY_DN6627_c1_g1_i3:102-662(-)
MNCKFERLSAEILALSHAKTFDEAVHEWTFVESIPCDSFCLCETPIRTEYLIYNSVTEMVANVGSTCIKRFIRRPCERCDEWTKHPQYCKRCEDALDKLSMVGYYECESAGCLRVLTYPGMCGNCCIKQKEDLKKQNAIKWAGFREKIDSRKLTSVELRFIDGTVREIVVEENYQRAFSGEQIHFG